MTAQVAAGPQVLNDYNSSLEKLLFLQGFLHENLIFFQGESVKTAPVVADFFEGLSDPDPKNEQYHDIVDQ